MSTASEIMRDYIVMDVIPVLEEDGQLELVDKLREAVEIGERSYMDFSEYWEGIRIFANNGLTNIQIKQAVEEIKSNADRLRNMKV